MSTSLQVTRKSTNGDLNHSQFVENLKGCLGYRKPAFDDRLESQQNLASLADALEEADTRHSGLVTEQQVRFSAEEHDMDPINVEVRPFRPLVPCARPVATQSGRADSDHRVAHSGTLVPAHICLRRYRSLSP